MRCDSHVHIVGPAGRYPQAVARTYTAGIAGLDALQALAARHEIARFVIVQPSFYGADNTMLLESLDRLGERGRGVVVVDPERVGARDLADMHRRGVRGLRINLYSPMRSAGAESVAGQLAAQAGIARRHGWHVEVIAPLETLIAGADVLARGDVDIVIDHYGLFGHHTPDDAAGRRLLALVARSHVWIKVSAPYRVSPDPLATTPPARWLDALIEVAPERCVWGSDWPFTPQHEAQTGEPHELPYRPISYHRLFHEFMAALPAGDGIAELIFEANPARLYGFGAS